ncbi:hypothetical protein WKI71_32485 [Streptomyces sp. MS1.AVA.1]|uniref:Uncharacterized protein n=1 Tax=Streptomyces machairae TaxID=3134109 RepID=A0ABU8US04_9ACTN
MLRLVDVEGLVADLTALSVDPDDVAVVVDDVECVAAAARPVDLDDGR